MGEDNMNKHKTKCLGAALLAAAILTLAGCAQNEKAPESAPASVTEPAAESVTEAVTEPAPESAPVAEPTIEAIAEPAAEAVTEPATEAATEPAAPAATTTQTTPSAEPAGISEAARDEANRKAQEQQAALDELIATPEQEEQAAKDKQERQEMADNTPAYTIDGIPLTTEGGLTEPAKPTKDYKLPKNAQLEFTGDASKAERTTLPDGCYWTPTPVYPEAFTDPAGNLWCNRDPASVPIADRGFDNGYISPDGEYYCSQAEIDRAAAIKAADHDINVNGPSGDGTSNMTQQEADELAEIFGFGKENN